MPVTAGKKINPDIEKERRSATFDIEELSRWWYGGAEKLREKREIEAEIFEDPDLNHDVPSMYYLSYQQMYDDSVRKCFFLAKKLRAIQSKRNPGGSDIFPTMLSGGTGAAITPQGSPLLLHHTMFIPTIKGQGTPEQVDKWLPRALKCNIIGTYAQTELGHGTFLRGLETRADYDPKTEEFILDSPTISAYKWWPGGLGHTANYAIVAAQLYINNKHHGIQMFLVQLRDEETHMPLPGIIVGEIGNKMAFQTVNNGYLGFKKLRIPRTNMLMKNSQVQRDGSFNKSPASVLTYFTMVQVRVAIVTTAHMILSRAATIATRYAAVRRQSVINPKEEEPQILDHRTQQMKLFPEIAKSLVIKISADYLSSMLDVIQQDLLNGELERLPEMHALTSCLKVIATKDSTSGAETLRLACGGHGYMLSSNLPLLYSFATAAMTYEGENTVLLLQTARYLMKAWALALKGEELVPTVAYLAEAVNSKRFSKWDGSWDCIVRALQFVSANKTRIAFNHLEERKRQQNITPEEATNLTSIELAAAGEIHGRAFLASIALKQIQTANVSDKLKAVLSDLLELYLVGACLERLSDILRFISLTEEDISGLQSRLENVLTKIRPNAVALVDSYDYHDRVLRSVLGSYDGNAYERIFESAQQSPMNKIPVQKSFEQYLKPFMRSNL